MANAAGTALCISLLLLTPGCSGLLVDAGDSYGCPGMPSGVQCMGAREVLSATQGRSSLSQAMPAMPRASGVPGLVVPMPASAREAAAHGTLPVAFAGPGQIPVRVPSQVMRVWIAPYEDVNGDLVMPGHLFTEVATSRWTVGAPAVSAQRHLTPLQAAAKADKAE